MANTLIWTTLLVVVAIYSVKGQDVSPNVDDDQVRLAVSDIREAQRSVKYLQDQLTNAIGKPDDQLKQVITESLSQLIRLELPLERALSRLNAAYITPQVGCFCEERSKADIHPPTENFTMCSSNVWTIQGYGVWFGSEGCYYSYNEEQRIVGYTDVSGKDGLMHVLQQAGVVPEGEFKPGQLIITDSIVVATVNKKQIVYSKVPGDNGLLLNQVTVQFNSTDVSFQQEGSKPVQWAVLPAKQSSQESSQGPQRVEL